MTEALSLSQLQKKFVSKAGERILFSGLDLKVEAGEFLTILGPSGCGKSTLLKIISGLDREFLGNLEIQADLKEKISMVFQESRLLPWLNVMENTLLPLKLQGQTDLIAAEEILSQVELNKNHLQFPEQLSGGMKMRTAIARALISSPKLLLMDEPFSALDEITRHRLQEKLRSLFESKTLTVIFVTHSISEAVFLSSRILVMGSTGQLIAEKRVDLGTNRNRSTRVSPEYFENVKNLSDIFSEISV